MHEYYMQIKNTLIIYMAAWPRSHVLLLYRAFVRFNLTMVTKSLSNLDPSNDIVEYY